MPRREQMMRCVSSLADLQRAFTAALDSWDSTVPAGVTAHSGALTTRMNTYRRNVHASLIGVLENRFPVVARLTGPEFFRAMAQLYLKQNLPLSPVLLDYGGEFPDFIASFDPANDVPYLADVARLEWLQNEAYHAADAMPLTAQALAELKPDTLAKTVFHLHPSMRLLRSPFPILAIWRTNAHDADIRPVDAAASGDDLLIVRPHLDVEIHVLPPGAFVLFGELAAGQCLADAATTASRSDHLNLQQALAGLIAAGCIVDYSHAT
jgi:hypothetical protein